MRAADPVLIEKLIPHSVEAISCGQHHSLATTRDGKYVDGVGETQK